MKKINVTTNHILWAVFLSLLAVLLPHTAWAFNNFEPFGRPGMIAAYLGAFAFECAIAVLTHKLSKHIEATPRRKAGWAKFSYRYLNAFSVGLLCALTISALANLSHAVEFGKSMKIFVQWGIPPAVYSLAFGAVLPFVSLLFARVLSNVVETEDQPDPLLEAAKSEIADLRHAVREVDSQRRSAEQRANEAEQKFAAASELFVKLIQGEKRERVLFAAQKWPELKPGAIAVITETSPSYVSEVLTGTNGSGREN